MVSKMGLGLDEGPVSMAFVRIMGKMCSWERQTAALTVILETGLSRQRALFSV
jgi:hypothetical protein